MLDILLKKVWHFVGKNERINEQNSEKFYALVKIIAKWNPAMQKYFDCIEHNEIHTHHLSHKIHNELIIMLANDVKNAIIKTIQKAKYFSIVLDCTSDVSHQKQQMTLVENSGMKLGSFAPG